MREDEFKDTSEIICKECNDLEAYKLRQELHKIRQENQHLYVFITFLTLTLAIIIFKAVS